MGSNNERRNIDFQTFIGLIQEKYQRHKAQDTNNQTFDLFNNHPSYTTTQNSNTSLKEHISEPQRCTHCNRRWHNSNECHFRGKEKCCTCQKFHFSKHCFKRKNGNNHFKIKKKKVFSKNNNKKGKPTEQAQIIIARDPQGDESGDEYIAEMDTPYGNPKVSCNSHECHCFSTTKISSNWDNNDGFNTYNWLGDTATTSHVFNQYDAFIDFQSENPKVKGVTNLKAMAKGRGTITVQAITDGQKKNCTLKNVLYIPSNQTNLFFPGSWETNGSYFKAKNNILSLKQKNGQTIIKGKKLKPNLDHLNLQIIRPENKVNIVQENKMSWTTWHL